MAEWLDITRPVEAGMAVYSPDEGFSAAQLCACARDGYNLSRFQMGAHCGTHLDAPAHFLKDGHTVDRAPLALLIGPARVLTVRDGSEFSSVPQGQTRLLLRFDGFPGLHPEQAKLLIRRGVRLLGSTGLSVARRDTEAETHICLLGGGVWLLENLFLEETEDGEYELACLPLRLEGLEGAPARAVIRRA